MTTNIGRLVLRCPKRKYEVRTPCQYFAPLAVAFWKDLTGSSQDCDLPLKRLKQTATMSMLLLWPESALILLAIGFFSILAIRVYRKLRSRKPDPHMTLLLALMKDFPKDQNSGSGGSGTPDRPESDEDLGPLGPGGFGSFALYDSGKNAAGCPSHLLGPSRLAGRDPQRVVFANRLPAAGSGSCAPPRADFYPRPDHRYSPVRAEE